jgi:NitT/TauT family transport system ATP-binding protein
MQIELRAVSHSFRTDSGLLPVLNEVSLSIAQGKRVGVVGPSGSGKTTLLRIVAGLVQPSAGKVLIQGAKVTFPGHRPNFFGMMFQEPALLDWRTVRENIVLPFELAVMRDNRSGDLDQRIKYFLTLTRLEQFANFRPAELSSGMKQRVALIRCLITRPAVLLLDEPFGALDQITRTKLWVEFDRIANVEKVTTLLVTHSIEEAVFLCDTILVLSSRPARVVKSLDVTLRGQRSIELLDDPEFLQLTKHVRHTLYDNAAENI